MKRCSILLTALSSSFAWAQKPPARKPQDLIIAGWWSMVQSQKITMEFAKDGTVQNHPGWSDHQRDLPVA